MTTTTLPSALDRYLVTHSAAHLTSTAAYVEGGGALVTRHAPTGLQALRPALRAKIARLPDATPLRTRLELLALFLEEVSTERAALTPAIREAAFALLYFLKGFDRIPDAVPEVGLLDDALVVQTVLERHATAMRAHWLRHRRRWPMDH
jgi:uncharacterized membrane protein YkvA (DUF1232 family)